MAEIEHTLKRATEGMKRAKQTGDDCYLIKGVPIKGKRRVIVTFLNEPLPDTDRGLEIDPIRVLKGCAKGSNLIKKLLESRREDLNLEESKWGK